MAKISELVKTYRLLSDPNAPDWNVRFVGGVVLALAVVAAATAVVWSATRGDGEPSAPAAAVASDGASGDLTACDPTEVAEELARRGGESLPQGHRLPSGCVIQ